MKFGKRQLILSALVIALGAAVYLNWQFGDNKLLATDASVKQLGQAQYVDKNENLPANNNSTSNTNPKSTQSNQSTSTTVPSTTISKATQEYFAQARTSRQQVQDKVVDIAKQVLSLSDSSDAAKLDAVKKASQIADIIQQQSNIESLIKSKGFSDCLAFIENGECNVVVTGGQVDEAAALAIKDIVNGQSNISFDKIKIMQK
ncbi:MAG: SpoIIIAH-like family protein [Bacillota bacterium]|nr:SpoIIIAH-like family protein [Bacillota bacterium]